MADLKLLKQRLAALKTEQSSFIPHWRELTDYLKPRSARYLTTERNKGTKKNDLIYDNTATLALRTLVSGMMAGYTSPARPWFRLTLPDEDMMEYGPVKNWLHDVTMKLQLIFAKSNLYNSLPQLYMSIGAYGTGAMCVLKDMHTVIRCYNYPVGQFLIGYGADYRVDTIYREFSMTVKQMVDEFGIDNCSQMVQDHYRAGRYDNWIEVVHAVEPRKLRDNTKKDAKNKPWLSVYFEKASSDKVLRESGFNHFPVLSPRWEVVGEDVYGESPGMLALGDIKELQHARKRKLQALDKIVNPPLVGDATLRNTRVSTMPGDMTYASGLQNGASNGIKPMYEVNPRVLEITQDIQETQGRIKRAFYEDVITTLLSSDYDKTATEVNEIRDEKYFVFGSVLERLNEEVLNPLIDIAFDNAHDMGLIPPPPPEMQGQQMRVEFTSVMAQSLRALGSSSIERFVGFVGNIAGIKPEVLDKWDADQTIDEYANMQGVPPKIIVPDDAVQQIRQGRQQAQQAQQMAAMAQPTLQGVQAAKLLSETDMSTPDSALSRLTG